jgi:protein-tyrosine phosphatase
VIDLHSHVLPGIDDGPPDLAESLRLVSTAEASGTTVLAATPHLRADHPSVEIATVAGRCAALEEQLPDDCRVKLVPAGELDLLWAQEASDEDLRLASFGGRGSDLLVETPYGPLPRGFEVLILRLAQRGFRLLLAHPERNPSFQREPSRIAELVKQGVLIQLTIPAVVRADGRSRSRRLALDLVSEGLAHNLASDAHSAGPRRSPDLGAGVRELAEVAPARAEWMVTDAAAAILEGAPLPAPPAERPARRRRRLTKLCVVSARSAFRRTRVSPACAAPARRA